MSKKLFITGATGYIGGSILTTLLKQNKYQISALVRDQNQATILTQAGVTPILGSLDDYDLLFNTAKSSDIVVNTADADHLLSTQALVNGLKDKHDEHAVFLHTSGTGELTYEGRTLVPFDDVDIDRIHQIPLTALHKDVDSWIFDNAQGITFAIIAPSTIHGIGSGLFKKVSQQVVGLAQMSALRGQSGYIGERTDVIWGNVHINDLVDLYVLLIEGLVNGSVDSGREGGWYFGSSDVHSWFAIAGVLAEVLFEFGVIKTKGVSQFEQEFLDKVTGGRNLIGFTNDSRCVSNRSRNIGWRPKSHPTVYDSVREEVRFMIDNGLFQQK